MHGTFGPASPALDSQSIACGEVGSRGEAAGLRLVLGASIMPSRIGSLPWTSMTTRRSTPAGHLGPAGQGG